MCEFISSKSFIQILILFNAELIWMKIRKEKKDGVTNLHEELHMSMFWLATGVGWLPGLELHRSLLNFTQEFV